MEINAHGFFESKDFNYHQCDKSLSEAIAKYLKEQGAQTVADMGCGNGEYTKAIMAQNIRAYGFDGNPYTPLLTQGLGRILDLSQPIYKPIQFEWVVSLEVGEHIPPEFEQNFLDNITNCAVKGVILSWAIPGQGGDGHFNEQENAYIITEMNKRGFRQDRKAGAALREVSTFDWFKNTVMVFKRSKAW